MPNERRHICPSTHLSFYRPTTRRCRQARKSRGQPSNRPTMPVPRWPSHLRDENERPTADRTSRRVWTSSGERWPVIQRRGSGDGADSASNWSVAPADSPLNPCSMSFGAGEFGPPQAVSSGWRHACKELDIKPELEVYDTRHLRRCLRLWAEDLLASTAVHRARGSGRNGAPPIICSDGAPAAPSVWQIIAIGKANMELTAMGLALVA